MLLKLAEAGETLASFVCEALGHPRACLPMRLYLRTPAGSLLYGEQDWHGSDFFGAELDDFLRECDAQDAADWQDWTPLHEGECAVRVEGFWTWDDDGHETIVSRPWCIIHDQEPHVCASSEGGLTDRETLDAEVECDDCYRTDGTHNDEVEH